MNDIDTSTTEGKIEVMRAFLQKEPIEYSLRSGIGRDMWESLANPNPAWDWLNADYRIKYKLPERQPLGPADFPPGTVVSWQSDGSTTWVSLLAVRPNEIELATGVVFTYDDLKNSACTLRRSLDGGKTWLPCYK